MPREFKATPAYRHAVPLLIGIAGPPGAGKTYSALTLATGIKAHRGGPIVLIDTERNRSLRYAPPTGVAANGVDHFDFMHVPFTPPFNSLDFLDAVMQQRVHKPSCIIIDSQSDEHEGEGGLLDFHDTELDRMAGNDWAKRERVAQAAWIKPKANRLEMLNGLMQIMTPLIFCFRAREKTKQIKNEQGKQVPTNIGWTPIAPPEVIHSMDLFALLPVKSDGVPMWKGNTAYEDFSIKLPRQFMGLFKEGQPINSSMGNAMSVWALGDQKLATPADTKSGDRPKTPARTEPSVGTTADKPSDDFPGDRPPRTARDIVQEIRQGGGELFNGPAEDVDDIADAEGLSGVSEAQDRLDREVADDSPEGEKSQPISDESRAATEKVQEGGGQTDDRAGEQTSESEPAATADSASGGFVDFADALASARGWPQIDLARADLMKSPEWVPAGRAMQEKARALAYIRLKELVDAGYRFDFISDLQSWRSYMAYETDIDALKGNRAAVCAGQAWKDLDRLPPDKGTRAKLALDKAFDDRIADINAARTAAATDEYA